MNAKKHILFGMLYGFILGFGLAICIVDDMDRFTLPFTDKTFERVDTQRTGGCE